MPADRARPEHPDASTSESTAERIPTQVLEPIRVPTSRIIVAGIGIWVLALVVTLVVPELHTADRGWWPWACVSGIGLGLIGLTYVRRGRGNAADAE